MTHQLPQTLLRLALLLILAASSLAAQAKVFLWEAERDGQRIWLLGSIHLGRADLYPLPAAIEAAYKEADTLAVEADISDPVAFVPLTAMAMLPAEQSLGSMLSPAQNRQLNQALARVNLPRVAADRMKPWLLALTLGVLEMQRLGFQPQNGIDMHFLQRARSDRKKVLELESVKAQFELFDSLTQEESLNFLLSTLEPINKQQLKPMLESTMAAWQRGDANALRRVIDDAMPNDPLSRRLNDKLLGQRNRTMADKIASMAAARPPLVVVGAGHLAGDDSVLELLKTRGFRIKQY
ncbi:GumN protein [Chitinimonas prasina]|uniref:GumN protein n=1 Tax=Chitinimonas prasina TaxID=1434937 RepID=A0ABQ5YF46_9NEIS|nr:TraB/GumN family protein [Chitinimonas prasina]GLR12278.1 GumN protein [Chitinimonas prasina]